MEIRFGSGSYPLDHLLLRGECLTHSGSYIVSWKSSEQISDVAVELPQLTEELFPERFRPIPAWELNESYEVDSGTSCFSTDLRDFRVRAASAGRHVLFVVDQ